MKKKMALLMVLSLLTACAAAGAEAPRSGGRGGGAGGGSMQTLNEGIACMNGDGVEQDCQLPTTEVAGLWKRVRS